MKQTLILLLLTFGMNAQKIKDDTKHFYAGSLISGVSGSAAYELGARPFHAACIGFGLGTLAGIAKEAIDGRGYGTEDVNDIYADTLGGITGSIISTQLNWRF